MGRSNSCIARTSRIYGPLGGDNDTAPRGAASADLQKCHDRERVAGAQGILIDVTSMERPPKKPRLHGPDGFQKSKPTSRYKPPESITKFVSAFDSPAPKSPPKKNAAATHDRLRNPFVDADVPNDPEAGPSRLSAPKPLKPSSFAHPPRLAAQKADKSLPALKILKPPVLLPPPAAVAPQTTKTASATPSSLKPTLKHPPARPEKLMSVLKPPPLPIQPSAKSSVTLKALAPPPFPERRPTSPTKPMKTILTTSIALATDPTKEGAGAELLSLFLKQHGHGFTSSTERELQRGVMVSPDKRSRGKDPKFVRYVHVLSAPVSASLDLILAMHRYSGGLAEHFQHRISCTKTDFVLWRRQMEQKLESGTKYAPDMRLRILRVLDVAKVPERSRFARNAVNVGPRAGLALCRLVRRHAIAGADLTLGTYVVVFHFGPTNGGRSDVSSVDRFAEGNDVQVWLPWSKVELVGKKECAELLEVARKLDALTPPRSLLVVSRFCIVVPRPPTPCDLT